MPRNDVPRIPAGREVADYEQADFKMRYGEVFVAHGPTTGDLFVVWGLLGAAAVAASLLLNSAYRVDLSRASLLAARVALCIFPPLAAAVAIGTFREFRYAGERHKRGEYSVAEGRVADFTRAV